MKHIFEYLFSKKSDLDKIRSPYNYIIYAIGQDFNQYSEKIKNLSQDSIYITYNGAKIWILSESELRKIYNINDPKELKTKNEDTVMVRVTWDKEDISAYLDKNIHDGDYRNIQKIIYELGEKII